jgi:putative ABC transport system permease protein
MTLHLEMKIEAKIAAGIAPGDAARQARQEFGNQSLIREDCRDMWVYRSIETLAMDLRFGLRTMLKTPGFTAIAVLTVALGIGANTAIFSVVNAVLLNPLPYPQAGRIVAIEEINTQGKRIQVTPANFLDWRAQNTVFSHLAAIFAGYATISTSKGDSGPDPSPGSSAAGNQALGSTIATSVDAERISLAMTSADFFEVFGAQAERGRLFVGEDEIAGHPAIAVISHGLWHRRFGGDPEMVGKPINIEGSPYTVVGIVADGFQYPDKTEVWVPPYRLAPATRRSMDVTQVRGFGFLSAVALLKPGVSIQKAADEMEVITGRLRQQYPETNNNRLDRVVSLQKYLVGDISLLLWLLLGAVGFVLLIACANVANLMLVRATGRQREIAVRTALGASRLRIMRQLLTESVALSFAGGLSGLLLAWWGLNFISGLLPKEFPRLAGIKVDLPVLWFTAAVSLTTGVLFGLAPAWQVSKASLQESLKEDSRGSGSARSKLRGLLVVSQVALSLTLLIGAGLLFRSFLRLRSVSAGFDPNHVLTLYASPSGPNFPDDASFVAYYRQVEERLAAIPGVESVGAVNTLPLAKSPTFAFRVEGRPPLPVDQWPFANYRNATPDYFQTLKIPMVRGRGFEQRDTSSSPLVVVINQAVADQDFAGEDPIGKRVNFGGVNAKKEAIWWEIVGVVGNIHNLSLDEAPSPEIYLSAYQDPFPGQSFVMRTSIDPGTLAVTARQRISEIDRGQPVSEIYPMKTLVGNSISQPRFNLILLGIFGVMALILSAAGIYGVMAYTVSRRTHELGIRVALGAGSRDVLLMVLGQGMLMAGIGIGVGVIASLALTRYLSSLLFGIGTTDSITFGSISLLLVLVALLACYIPARRGLKVDPMSALRYE